MTRRTTFTCDWCGHDSPKDDWGPGRVTCPMCHTVALNACDDPTGMPRICDDRCGHYPEAHVVQASAETRAWLALMFPQEHQDPDKWSQDRDALVAHYRVRGDLLCPTLYYPTQLGRFDPVIASDADREEDGALDSWKPAIVAMLATIGLVTLTVAFFWAKLAR